MSGFGGGAEEGGRCAPDGFLKGRRATRSIEREIEREREEGVGGSERRDRERASEKER